MAKRDDLIRQIYENGNYAIKKVCEMESDDKMANFSATDCIIGTTNTHLALKIATERVIPQTSSNTLKTNLDKNNGTVNST